MVVVEMPSSKRHNLNPGTDNEMSGNESEISVSSRENPNRDSSDDDHDSDDSSDMDLAECETRRTDLLKDVQDLESQFNILREQLYRERMQQVDDQISELKAGTSVQYVTQLKLLEEERRARIEVSGILREVRIANLTSHYEAEKLAALQNFQNEKMLAHDDYHNDLLETIKELEEDKRNSEIAWGEGGKWGARKKTPCRMKKAVTVSGPYIVYMLKPEEILEDWTAIRKSCQNT